MRELTARFEGLPPQLELAAKPGRAWSKAYWKILKPFTCFMSDGHEIRVPLGGETDLTSIPWFVPMPREGLHTPAAICHDFTYKRGYIHDAEGNRALVSRRHADRIFLLGMLELGTDPERAELIHMGVRLGGWWPWWRYRMQERHHEAIRTP